MNLPFNVKESNFQQFVLQKIREQERVDIKDLTVDIDKGKVLKEDGLLAAVFRPVGDTVVFYWYETALNCQFFKTNAERHYSFVRPQFRLGWQHDGAIGIELGPDCKYVVEHKDILIKALRNLDTDIFDIKYNSFSKEIHILLHTPDHTPESWKTVMSQFNTLNQMCLDIRDN